MKDLIPIKVVCHSGFKADEYPKSFYWDNIKFEIKEILDRWYQDDQNPDFQSAIYFKVLTSDDKTYLIKHEQNRGNWFLLIYGESINL